MRKNFLRRKASGGNKTKTEKLGLKQRISQTTGHWNFRKIAAWMATFAVVIGLITSWFWYKNLYMTPERRFYAALNNSMATPSVVRTLTQGGSGNQVVQQYRFHFAPQRFIENEVTYTERSATTNTTIVTEGIVYPTEQYLRYSEFDSTTQGSAAFNIDELLGEWAYEESLVSEEAQLNYLSEQVSLAIFGNFDANIRHDMLREMKERGVYSSDFKNAVTNTINEEEVMVYSVSVKLKPFAEILNRSFERAGYGAFPPLDPANYREDAAVNANFMVRMRDNSIAGISFGGREESYSNYGVMKEVQKPEAVRSITELQGEVQQLFNTQNEE